MAIKTITRQNVSQYVWGNNCKSFNLLNTDGLSVKQEEMPPATSEKLHFHNKANQFFFMLKGTGTFCIGTEITTVNPQEGIHVEPGQQHYIANRSGETIEFLVISQPSTGQDRIEVDKTV